MKDLTNWTWIKLKGLLFLLIGILAAVVVLGGCPRAALAATPTGEMVELMLKGQKM